MIAINFVVAVLIAGLAVAGWFIANQQQVLAATQNTLGEANTRLLRLEKRLRVTDETMSESGADTNEQFTLWESEIRKLWDITNKRNKKWIEANQTAVGKHTAAIASTESTLRTLKSAVDRNSGAFTQQQAIVDQITLLDLQVRELMNQRRDLIDKVNTSNQIASGLKAGLEARVRENEQAIAAIDAYRLQVNARLSEMQRRIDLPKTR
ncbi:MAG: hypothetical protein O7H39_20195 [Gammaproteobacteria bacterium]|nr:hypothetical protein [Gammaproteobacteria bacterium]